MGLIFILSKQDKLVILLDLNVLFYYNYQLVALVHK